MAAVRIDFVKEINPSKESWDIVVQVIRLWFVPDMNSKEKFFAMEMVLMDEKGDKIQASVRKALLSRFENKIREGTVYNFKSFSVAANTGGYRTTKHQFKLNLQNGTVVTEMLWEFWLRLDVKEFMRRIVLPEKCCCACTVLDVVGILASVGRERVYEKNRVTTKYKVIELESNGMKLECTLFGPCVAELNAYLQSGYPGNVVVLAQYFKVKMYNGKIQLQNAMNCTKLMFNPEIPEANSFKLNDNIGSPTQPFSYMKDSSDLSLEEEFLNLSQRKTIEELKDCQNEMVCVVLGTIKHVIGGNDWRYAAHACNRGVVADSKRLSCPKCNKHVWTIVTRYRVKLRVIDETDSATFVLFDHDCCLLTNKTCFDLIEEINPELEPPIVPKVIGDLVEQTFIFKIDVKNDVNSSFEQSFRVKKVCADKDIVTKFKSVVKNSASFEDDLADGVVQSEMASMVVQDLNSIS
ncbi:uncharacterized protein LOC131619844 [Vicia villosa]|uniref:uncharacterized protein LOC131619844 n=1 Tax=Vicia villosa TaxID=3911 RepID=UPI00273AE59B|nr:uncharacterized protein LOC131619844 [Vicia villosa]